MRTGFVAGLLAGLTLGALYVVRNGPPLELAAFPIPWGLKMATPVAIGGFGGAAWGAVGGAIGGGTDADTNGAIFGGMVAATVALVLFTVTQNVHDLAKLAYAGLSIVVFLIVAPLAFGGK